MKNPFGLKERTCKKSDFTFFRNLISRTLRKYVEEYAEFDFSHVRNSFKKTFSEVKILMKGNKRIGLYQIRPKGKKLEIVRIFLTPSYQKKKIGLWYMKHFETLGYKTLELEVWGNNPARFFYKKLGYKKVKQKNHKILMQKKL